LRETQSSASGFCGGRLAPLATLGGGRARLAHDHTLSARLQDASLATPP